MAIKDWHPGQLVIVLVLLALLALFSYGRGPDAFGEWCGGSSCWEWDDEGRYTLLFLVSVVGAVGIAWKWFAGRRPGPPSN